VVGDEVIDRFGSKGDHRDASVSTSPVDDRGQFTSPDPVHHRSAPNTQAARSRIGAQEVGAVVMGAGRGGGIVL